MELTRLLTKLKMEHLDAQLDAVCEQAAQRELDYKSFLCEALSVEWNGRDQKGLEARLRQARLPWLKTLEQFDFEFQPSLDRRQVRELAGVHGVHIMAYRQEEAVAEIVERAGLLQRHHHRTRRGADSGS